MADTPATRRLSIVLRNALQPDDSTVELIVCKDSTGKPAYVLAARGRLLYLGTVAAAPAGFIDVVIDGVTVNIPKVV